MKLRFHCGSSCLRSQCSPLFLLSLLYLICTLSSLLLLLFRNATVSVSMLWFYYGLPSFIPLLSEDCFCITSTLWNLLHFLWPNRWLILWTFYVALKRKCILYYRGAKFVMHQDLPYYLCCRGLLYSYLLFVHLPCPWTASSMLNYLILVCFYFFLHLLRVLL